MKFPLFIRGLETRELYIRVRRYKSSDLLFYQYLSSSGRSPLIGESEFLPEIGKKNKVIPPRFSSTIPSLKELMLMTDTLILEYLPQRLFSTCFDIGFSLSKRSHTRMLGNLLLDIWLDHITESRS